MTCVAIHSAGTAPAASRNELDALGPEVRESPHHRRPGGSPVALQSYVALQQVIGDYGAFNIRTREAIALVVDNADDNYAPHTGGPIMQVSRPSRFAAGKAAISSVSWVCLLGSRAWVRFGRRRLPVPAREGQCVGGFGRRCRCRGEGSTDHGPGQLDVHGLCRRSRSLVLAPRPRPRSHRIGS